MGENRQLEPLEVNPGKELAGGLDGGDGDGDWDGDDVEL
jgi:hypothetical protein